MTITGPKLLAGPPAPRSPRELDRPGVPAASAFDTVTARRWSIECPGVPSVTNGFPFGA
jgi:hypothetical protein